MRLRLTSTSLRYFAGFAAIVASSASCGAIRTDAGTDAPIGGNSVCARYYRARNAFNERCGRQTPFGLDSTDRLKASDVARFETLCSSGFAAAGASSLGAGLERCIQIAETAPCARELRCDVYGTLDDGAPCSDSNQCKGYCDRSPLPDSTKLASCGTCASLVPTGGECRESRDCGPDATCSSRLDHGVCQRNANKAVGEDCTVASECAAELVCYDSTCRPPSRAGDACQYDRDFGDTCAAGTSCISAADRKSSSCHALGGEGEHCDHGQRGCAAGLRCSVDATCLKPVSVGLGDTCDLVRQCGEGECLDFRLEEPYYPWGTPTVRPGTCKVPVADGQACQHHEDCDSFADCLGGRCTLRVVASCQ